MFSLLLKDLISDFYFTRHSSPMNCSLILEEVIREYNDQRKPLYVAFLDVKSAFDVVSHDSLLRKLFHIGAEGTNWTLIHSLHQGAESVIKWKGAYSETFEVHQGVRQGGWGGGYSVQTSTNYMEIICSSVSRCQVLEPILERFPV